MPETHGINHLGLTVLDLEETTRFFVEALGWTEAGRDPAYPRTLVTDGVARLTLWQVDRALRVEPFDRRKNVGLHHVALQVATEGELHALAGKLKSWPGVTIEFMPELLGTGPRRHMMLREPGGLRIELIWAGS